jgi:hypothetical protein
MGMGWGSDSILEHLPSKHKALSSNPSTEKKKKHQKKGRKEGEKRERIIIFASIRGCKL